MLSPLRFVRELKHSKKIIFFIRLTAAHSPIVSGGYLFDAAEPAVYPLPPTEPRRAECVEVLHAAILITRPHPPAESTRAHAESRLCPTPKTIPPKQTPTQNAAQGLFFGLF